MKPLVILAGPTAVGKTALSIKLAKKINGAVISADSMQVYKHMDIGSAKVMPEEMKGIPHYLIDVLEPSEVFNIVRFQQMAKEALQQIYTAGQIPIIAGGTGFYIQAVTRDIDFTQAEQDDGYRADLEAIVQEKGAAYLVEGDAKRYIPIVPQEFCGNRIRRLEKELEWLQQNLPSESVEEDGYITVEGKKNIADKIHHLLTGAEERVYFSCSKGCLEEFKEELLQLVRRGKKVVLITDESFPMKEVIVYVTRKKEQQIGLIVDSRYVLSGEYGMGSMNTCVYSGQRNFVTVFKNALANEIELIKIRKGEKKDEQETICYKGTG